MTTELSDWATNCPEYKVTAVQLTRVESPSAWQQRREDFVRELDPTKVLLMPDGDVDYFSDDWLDLVSMS